MTYNKVSKSFSLNKQDIVSALRSVAIWYGPVFLMALDQFQTNGMIDKKVIIALAISTTVDLLRRYIRGLSLTQK